MENQNNNNNLQPPARIARNTSYLTLAFIGQKIISLAYFIYIARNFGAGNTGDYVSALSFTTLFAVLVDLGLSQVLIRETARTTERAKTFLHNVLTVKFLSGLVTYGLIFLVINLVDRLGYLHPDMRLVYVAGAIMLLDSFTLSFYAIFRGFQTLKYEAIGTVIQKLVVVSIGVISVKLGLPVIFALLAILAGSIFNFLFSSILLFIKKRIALGFAWDKALVRALIKIAIPFAIAGLFTGIYGNIDNVLLVSLAGKKYVGWYTTAYKLTFALQFFPAAVAASIFPAMSAYFVSSKELLKKTFEKAMFYLIIISLPISAGIFFLADRVILKLYGQVFEASILPLQILISALVVIFLNYPVGYLLNACNRQTTNTINIAITMVVNIILNIILIPRYTFVGASISALISSYLLFFLGLFWAGRIIPYDKIYLLKTLFKSLVAAGGMVYALSLIEDKIRVVFSLKTLDAFFYFGIMALAGGFVYLLILFITRGFLFKDVMRIYNSLVKKVL